MNNFLFSLDLHYLCAEGMALSPNFSFANIVNIIDSTSKFLKKTNY